MRTYLLKVDNPFSIVKQYNGEMQISADRTETQIVEITVKCRIDCFKECKYEGDIELISDYDKQTISEKKEA